MIMLDLILSHFDWTQTSTTIPCQRRRGAGASRGGEAMSWRIREWSWRAAAFAALGMFAFASAGPARAAGLDPTK